MTRIASLTTLCVIAALSACGPSVRGNTATVVTPPPAPQPVPIARTFQSRDRDRVELLNDFSRLDTTFPTRLPPVGQLRYAGHLNANLADRAEVIGDLAVTVDLTRDRISGGAGNFVDRFNRPYRGELELFNGSFDATPPVGDYQSQAGVRGTLRDPFLRDYAISGQLEGDVLGRDAQGYEAVLQGAVKVDGGPQQPIKGGAVAVRR